MKISLNWLKNYIELKKSPEELAHILTMAGLEVEEIATIGEIPAGVVVARILSRDTHPNSDHLSICQVDAGNGNQFQIVCGAPNCDAGKTVPLATLGTVFKDPEGGKDFEIKKAKLRGVESFGMMCSARELGLGCDHDGLMILPEDWELGKPLSDYIEKDTVYTVEITPNRPDWLSHWGVARDVWALCGGRRSFPNAQLPSVAGFEDWNMLVKVEAPDLCPEYTARVIRGVKVAPSPKWLKERLEAVGIRPINNIVDITNFVMMEFGEPLHAFDTRFLKDKRIVVRRAAENEKIVALDGKTYDLDNNTLVIADTEKPVAIAGVMGGEYSGVLDDTTEVLLESAYFNPTSVRMTSRKLGLSTDASYRFERGVDPDMLETASNRAASLILELAGGELVSELIRVKTTRPEHPRIMCCFSKINSLLGLELTAGEIVDILRKIGLGVSNIEDDTCLVTIPGFRADIKENADLAEEVARIYGFDKLPAGKVNAIQAQPYSEDAYAATEKLRDQLIASGLDDCVNVSMLDEKTALSDPLFEAGDLLKMNNPISLDLAVLRPSILPGLLACVKRNVARKNQDLALFEIGHVFCSNPAKYPEERDELAIIMTGRAHAERYSAERAVLFDFYDIKGVLESVLELRRTRNFEFKPATDPRFAKGVCAELLIDGKQAGVLGKLHDKMTKGMRIQTPVYAAVIQLDSLLNAEEKSINYEPVSQFPPVTRDVAFLAPKELDNKTVLDFIASQKINNLVNAEVFDIFSGAPLPEGAKSMAYSLTFRSMERTLTDVEVNTAHEKLRDALAKKLGVELR
ncbi:MAG: phenylalanine--tRNA ligase subunit beta [Lentisphaeria bacterium]|nr:phenylalanine--tRNA ligase subunit beta [Lentisphaeria bacterium]